VLAAVKTPRMARGCPEPLLENEEDEEAGTSTLFGFMSAAAAAPGIRTYHREYGNMQY